MKEELLKELNKRRLLLEKGTIVGLEKLGPELQIQAKVEIIGRLNTLKEIIKLIETL